MQIEFAVGIDVGKISGVAWYYLPDKKLVDIQTMSSWKLIEYLLGVEYADNIVFLVEDPNMDSKIYGSFYHIEKLLRPYTGSRAVVSHGTMQKIKSAFGIAMKHASGVGQNRGNANQVIDLLKTKGANVLRVNPSWRQRYDTINKKMNLSRATVRKSVVAGLTMPTKLKRPDFELLTGWGKMTNEHARDAATLVYGINDRTIAALQRRQPKVEKKK